MAKTGATIQVGAQVHELLPETVTIGREGDNQIVIDDQSVSGHHAEILFLDGRHVVRDLGSTNGTRVNGVVVKETALEGGSSISFGVVECAFSAVSIPGEAEAKAKGGARGNLLLYGLGFAALTLFVASFLVGKKKSLHPSSQFGATAQEGFGGEAQTDIHMDDPSNLFGIKITRVLVGDSVVKNGVYYKTALDDARKLGNELFYLQIAFTNFTHKAKYVSQHDFSLEDSDGFTYSEKQTRDVLNGEVQPGKGIRGGIGFQIPKECRPARLVFKTGYTRRGTDEEIYYYGDLLGVELLQGSSSTEESHSSTDVAGSGSERAAAEIQQVSSAREKPSTISTQDTSLENISAFPPTEVCRAQGQRYPDLVTSYKRQMSERGFPTSTAAAEYAVGELFVEREIIRPTIDGGSLKTYNERTLEWHVNYFAETGMTPLSGHVYGLIGAVAKAENISQDKREEGLRETMGYLNEYHELALQKADPAFYRALSKNRPKRK